MARVTPNDRPKSVRSHCVIELFGGVLFSHFLFRHRLSYTFSFFLMIKKNFEWWHGKKNMLEVLWLTSFSRWAQFYSINKYERQICRWHAHLSVNFTIYGKLYIIILRFNKFLLYFPINFCDVFLSDRYKSAARLFTFISWLWPLICHA